jgi:hypothetical protein
LFRNICSSVSEQSAFVNINRLKISVKISKFKLRSNPLSDIFGSSGEIVRITTLLRDSTYKGHLIFSAVLSVTVCIFSLICDLLIVPYLGIFHIKTHRKNVELGASHSTCQRAHLHDCKMRSVIIRCACATLLSLNCDHVRCALRHLAAEL